MDTLDWEMVVNDEENSCRFESQRKETWIYMQPAGERMLWSFILTKLVNSSTHSSIGCGIYKFLIVGTIFNLAKVNTVPLSHRQRVDDWLYCLAAYRKDNWCT